MINSVYVNLINAIRNKMSRNEVIWINTSSSSQYKLLLDSSTIAIDKWNSHLGQFVRFDIINDKGNTIARIMYKDPISSDFEYLSTFYYEVERYYTRNTEMTIQGTLNEISREGIIGSVDDEMKK